MEKGQSEINCYQQKPEQHEYMVEKLIHRFHECLHVLVLCFIGLPRIAFQKYFQK